MKRFSVAVAMMLVLRVGLAGAQDLSGLARVDPAASAITDTRTGITVELALSQPVPYRVFTLADPPRLVVDFREADFSALSAGDIDRSRQVTAVRWGRFRPGWSRLVAELGGPFRLDQAAMSAGGSGPGAVLSLRLTGTDAAGFAARSGTPDSALWALPAPAQTDPPRRRQTGERPLLVVLDAGHGGIDPGAESGTLTEAGVTLGFARELADTLRRAGMAVVMTREDDVFVPLETRVSVARAAGADLFLSLHADALAEGQAVGATVYKLAEAASDAASARLAERHDRADILAGVDLNGQDDEVAAVLMSLARTETRPRTDRLAAELAAAIQAAGLTMHRSPVQGAGFSVLKSADIPSVLLELGFLSSDADRSRLGDPVWRAAMRGAILAGLSGWSVADAAEARLLRQ